MLVWAHSNADWANKRRLYNYREICQRPILSDVLDVRGPLIEARVRGEFGETLLLRQTLEPRFVYDDNKSIGSLRLSDLLAWYAELLAHCLHRNSHPTKAVAFLEKQFPAPSCARTVPLHDNYHSPIAIFPTKIVNRSYSSLLRSQYKYLSYDLISTITDNSARSTLSLIIIHS